MAGSFVVLYGCETLLPTLTEECRLRVFENSVLRRVFGHKWDKVMGEWRKLHNELNILYCSPNIVWVIKLRRTRWAGHVAGVEERSGAYRVWWGNLRGKDHFEDPGIDGRIILRWIFRKWDMGIRTGSSWLRIGTGALRVP